jgi:excisionase family DNA binding protein
MARDFNPTEWTTTIEVAELTGYDYARVRRLAREGHIEAEKLGRAWLVRRKSLMEYAEKMKELSAAKHHLSGTGAREKEED